MPEFLEHQASVLAFEVPAEQSMGSVDVDSPSVLASEVLGGFETCGSSVGLSEGS
jgi:hypothetical protein